MADAGGMNPQQQQIRLLMQQPKYQQLIRPDRIQTVTSLSDADRSRFASGCRSLWNVLQTKPPEDPQHQTAVTKLQQLTQHILSAARKATPQNQQTPQAGGPRPASQGQQGQSQQNGVNPQQQGQVPQTQLGQQGQRPQQAPHQIAQQGMPQASGTAMSQVPEQYRKQAEAVPWITPPNQQGDPETYREELKRRYAEAAWKRDTSQQVLQHLSTLQQQGAQMPPNAAAEHARSTQTFNSAKSFLDTINGQQAALRAQQSQGQGQAANQNGASGGQQSQSQQPAGQQPMQGANNARPQNAALEAARQQQMNRPLPGSPVTAQPASAGTPGQQTPTAAQNFQNMQRPSQPFGQSPQMSAPGSAMAQQPPQVAQGQQPQAQQPQQQPTVPFTHQNAMDAAAKQHQSNAAAPQQTGAPAQVQGQPMTRPEMDKPNTTRWPINKEFRPQPPQPVSMGGSRPTLAGPNSSAMGMIGQPALQQPPTYSLHGPGDRVLDKKKLDELVRQVCGAGDGSGQQSLHPEVEELADEFFDNVVTQACKLAKLRGGNTLEIRDIQLVLQKQYNIRIPGYSTDEVRTVRKTQPTHSYLQKMNAVQAAKVMGGKADV